MNQPKYQIGELVKFVGAPAQEQPVAQQIWGVHIYSHGVMYSLCKGDANAGVYEAMESELAPA